MLKVYKVYLGLEIIDINNYHIYRTLLTILIGRISVHLKKIWECGDLNSVIIPKSE